ncbi:MAG: hypothetical protein FJ297_04550 [Planctomycetes bacterium]|nr:hypothetical protein [Planctomycetota bacterium]
MLLFESKPTKRCLPACLQLLLIALLTGCHGAETEEAEHHTPAHMPADYPAGVDRLLALHMEIANGGSRAMDQLDAFAETYDIVRWLPMLAADSDLEEEPWNRVHATARQLEAILAKVVALNGDNRRQTYMQYETELDQHQRAMLEIKQHFPAANTAAARESP